MEHTIIPSEKLTFSRIENLLKSGSVLVLGAEAVQRISACRDYLDSSIFSDENPVYGINTGFGSLCDTRIAENELELLQRNLLLSHACGMGNEVPKEIIKLMLLLKIQGLSYGHSGVQLITVQRLVDFYNRDILPVVYDLGSLGASGDLSPLAHLSLPLIGEGEVHYKGKKVKSIEALKAEDLSPISLKSKEGLALINGTQFMSAYSVYVLLEMQRLFKQGLHISAMSIDAFDARPEPFDTWLHQVRAHNGQSAVAEQIRTILKDSEIFSAKKSRVQDPYSFRCIPQVHGASLDAMNYAIGVVETEINSVTDNPIIIPSENRIISGGNFHGQPLALILDFIAIAMSELASISERRIYKLISGQRGLPDYLTNDAGLNSGFMIAQYTAAAIVSQNKQLCTPASVDTIDSSNGQEDHVSMGANAATKSLRVLLNLSRVLSIELLAAAQALEFRRPSKSSAAIEDLHGSFRKQIPSFENDVFMSQWMNKSNEFLSHWHI